jgi:hypothetical protein
MAVHISLQSVGRWLRGLFVARTNAGVWLRAILFTVLVNVVGIVLSLLFFVQTKETNTAHISVSVTIPKTDTVDRASVQATVRAFADRVAAFEALSAAPISIPDLYTGGGK